MLEDNERAVQLALSSFGKLDIFVGNAGLFDYFAGIVDTPADELNRAFDELFGVNVKGYLLGVKAALPHLLEHRGCVVLTASMGSFHAATGGTVYTAPKHAVVGLVRQLAFELARRSGSTVWPQVRHSPTFEARRLSTWLTRRWRTSPAGTTS